MRAVLATIVVVACTPGQESTRPTARTDPTVAPDGLTADDEAALAAAERMYAPDHVARIDLEMAPADSDALAAQTRSILDLIEGEDCLEQPMSSPFTWFEANVTVDGERLERVGISKKGLIGSLSAEKPGLKLDSDRFVEGRTWSGIEHLTLNNSVSDPTLIRQCLGYGLFAEAGLPAPRCAFAHVTGMGNDLGVYVNVEPLKKDWLKFQYGSDDDGDLYEGTLSDLRDGWLGTFEPKTDDTDPEAAALHRVAEVLTIEDDASMLAALEPLVDLDRFAAFWAMEVIVGHIDGYAGNTNNFFVYRVEGTETLEFVPWGIDATFQRFDAFGSSTTAVTMANAALPHRLWAIPSERRRYLDTLRRLLDEVWDEDAILAEIDRMAALVEPYALPDDQRAVAQEDLRDFVRTRRAELEALIDAPAPEFGPLRDPPCAVEIGTIDFVFETTWDTLEVPDPFVVGAADVVADLAGSPMTFGSGAVAGDADGYGLIAGVGFTSPTRIGETVVVLPTSDVRPGTFVLDGISRVGQLLSLDVVTEEAVVEGTVWDGTVELYEASTAPGAPIAGRMQGRLFVGGP